MIKNFVVRERGKTILEYCSRKCTMSLKVPAKSYAGLIRLMSMITAVELEYRTLPPVPSPRSCQERKRGRGEREDESEKEINEEGNQIVCKCLCVFLCNSVVVSHPAKTKKNKEKMLGGKEKIT